MFVYAGLLSVIMAALAALKCRKILQFYALRRRIQSLLSRRLERTSVDKLIVEVDPQSAPARRDVVTISMIRPNRSLVSVPHAHKNFRLGKAKLNRYLIPLMSILFAVLILKLAAGMTIMQFLAAEVLAIIPAAAIIHSVEKRRRARQFATELPEIIEMIARGVRAGQPLVESIYNAGLETQNTAGCAMLDAASNVRLGMNIDEALSSMEKTWKSQELSYFRSSIAIHHEIGGNITNILMNMALGMRAKNLLQKKIHALSSEAKISATIMAVLPFIVTLVLFLVRPSYMIVLLHDPRGKYLLALSLMGIITGCLITMIMARVKD